MIKLWGSLLLGVIGLGGTGIAGEMLLAFTAEWCGPCQQFKADYMRDASLTAGYTVEIIDAEKAQEMAKDFGVVSYPTFIVVKVAADDKLNKNNVVKKQSGYTGPEKFKAWLKR